jgi:hypothetical protein
MLLLLESQKKLPNIQAIPVFPSLKKEAMQKLQSEIHF